MVPTEVLIGDGCNGIHASGRKRRHVGVSVTSEGGLGLDSSGRLKRFGWRRFGEPPLAETMDDAGQIASKDFSELAFDLALDVALDYANGVEAA